MSNEITVRMYYAQPPSLGVHLLRYTGLGSCGQTKLLGDGKLYQRSESAKVLTKGSVPVPTSNPLTFAPQEPAYA